MNLSDREKQALKIISSQHEGQIFLKAMMRESGYQKPSIVLSTLGEVDIKGTMYNEARRGFWLDMRSHIEPDKLVSIELDEKAKPVEVKKDVNHERSNSSSTDTSESESGDIGGTVRRKREYLEHHARQFATDFISSIYPPDPSDNPDNGGA